MPLMDGTCMELALEGERLCKAGDCRTGVQFFEAAVKEGTDDLHTLSAIYSQLGNAYFYLQEYAKALEYHKHDLNLARTIGDKLGEAKASGNLGNTLKVLGKFEEAIACCQRHLDISRELSDRVGEARALYNIGNVYHAKGKHTGRTANQDPGEFSPEVKEALQKAAEYYQANLDIVRELNDRAAQGRACGNLGNTHYLLGNFSHAIAFHEERLAIAKEFGDKSAERRAYSNLGNAHIFLGQFEYAAEHYKKTLQIAQQLGDRALEAQACYSLGNTYTLMRAYDEAIHYHLMHLKIAQALRDKVGEGRACWSLGNAHTALGNHQKAIQYATRHLDISQEIGDQMGQITAQMNLSDLRNILGISGSDVSTTYADTSSISTATGDQGEEFDAGMLRPNRSRRKSMEHMDLLKMTPDKQKEMAAGGARPKAPKVQRAATIATEVATPGSNNAKPAPSQRPKSAAEGEKQNSADPMDDDGLFDLLTKFQSRRMDEQRCSLRVLGNENGVAGQPHTPKSNKLSAPLKQESAERSPQGEEFLDMVAGIQAQRMNDQRADLPEFPGLHNSPAVLSQLRSRAASMPDDHFFDILMRCQATRIEDQRSSLPEPTMEAPTVPDEDFFNLIQRVQSSRLEEQRTSLPESEEPTPLKRSDGSSKKKKDKK